MILELLEWCFTPTSWSARTNGLLAEQIAIRHRASRCRRIWRSHLQNSKSFVNRHVSRGKHVAILGSGHLRDIDPRHLKSTFSRITLVDVVHPLEVQILALFSGGRIQLRVSDLSGALHAKESDSPMVLDQNLRSHLKGADVLVSCCLLTQLGLPIAHRWEKRFDAAFVEAGVRRIQQHHIDLLSSASKAILITDTAQRYGCDEWSPLLSKVRLPEPRESWLWDIAPPEEHGLKGLGAEQRRVEAFFFTSSGHENLCRFATKE